MSTTLSSNNISFSSNGFSVTNSAGNNVLSDQYSSALGKYIVSQKYRPAFDAESTVQYNLNTYIKHAREIHDAHGNYNPSTGRFTAPVSGIYLVYGGSGYVYAGGYNGSVNTANSNLFRHYIRINDVNINANQHIRVDAQQGTSNYSYANATVSAGYLVSLNAGDWVSFYVGTGFAPVESSFGAYLIG